MGLENDLPPLGRLPRYSLVAETSVLAMMERNGLVDGCGWGKGIRARNGQTRSRSQEAGKRWKSDGKDTKLSHSRDGGDGEGMISSSPCNVRSVLDMLNARLVRLGSGEGQVRV